MLTQTEIERIERIAPELESEDNRKRCRAWREVLHLYEDVATRSAADDQISEQKEFITLKEWARRAFTALGGMPEPVFNSLRHYEHTKYGTYLGVSDEGGEAERIRDAFLKSPKALAYGVPRPLIIGCAVDAERLGGAGEVPVGPDEYCDIQMACAGRVLTTTNVGTRVNARYYNDPPNFTIFQSDKVPATRMALAKTKALLEPYLHPPGGKPVPATLFVSFRFKVPRQIQVSVLRVLKKEMQLGRICDPSVHRLGLLVRAPRGSRGPGAVRQGLSLAGKIGIGEVAVDGVLRREAQERISMPGLLNFFDRITINKLWADAEKKGILLRAWKIIDVDSVARNTWTSLQTARNAGLYLGKYGLLPLTLPEADYVIGKIQSWLKDWSAAPAVYVDCPTVTKYRCYEDEAGEAVHAWLDILHKHKVPVVLIDTADKSKGRRLLKDGPGDEVGILTEREIGELNDYAYKLGIKTLWAGGISAEQAYRLGKMGVFGVYTTTSTARKVAVSGDYTHDPSMPNEKEPTYRGVCRVALLLQAGFIQGRMRSLGELVVADQVAHGAEELLALKLGESSEEREKDVQRKLAQSLQNAWRILLERTQ